MLFKEHRWKRDKLFLFRPETEYITADIYARASEKNKCRPVRLSESRPRRWKCRHDLERRMRRSQRSHSVRDCHVPRLFDLEGENKSESLYSFCDLSENITWIPIKSTDKRLPARNINCFHKFPTIELRLSAAANYQSVICTDLWVFVRNRVENITRN